MKLIGLKTLIKLKKKQRGNVKLLRAIDQLIKDIKEASWETKEDVLKDRSDADCVHGDGFYFFNIDIHRTMILIEYIMPDDESDKGIAQVLWCGSHDEYERLFKNNKRTIERWLRMEGLID